MKTFITSAFLVCLTACSVKQSQDAPLTLWYNTPADATAADHPYTGYKDDPEWVKALPLGNGSLGAMVFGGVYKERIQLNEETLWSGSMQDCDNPEAANQVEKIKQLLFEGKYKEATELTNRTQVCTGQGSGYGQGINVPFGCYQTLGDLWLDFAKENRQIVEASVKSLLGNKCRIWYNGHYLQTNDLKKGETWKWNK